MTVLTGDSIKYGQVSLVGENKQHRKEVILNSLRDIAFAKPA